MSDIIDDANEAADIFLASALTKRQDPGPFPTGHCHFCGEAVPPGHRWCDADCRDDWQREQDRP